MSSSMEDNAMRNLRAVRELNEIVHDIYVILADENWIDSGCQATSDQLQAIDDELSDVASVRDGGVAKALDYRSNPALASSIISLLFQCPDNGIAAVCQKHLLTPLRQSIPNLDFFLRQMCGEGAGKAEVAPTMSTHQYMISSGHRRAPCDSIEALGRLSPSLLFPSLKPVLLEGDDGEKVSREKVYRDIFVSTGEVCNYYRLLSTFPALLLQHHQTMQQLLFGEGPLTTPERLLLAIMASAQHDCQYLYRRFCALYFALGSEHAPRPWLHGEIPEKFRAIMSLNALAAHRPWALSGDDITRLTREHGWQVSQILQAICIFATVHSLSGFVEVTMVTSDPNTTILPEEVSSTPSMALLAEPTVQPGSDLPAYPRASVGKVFVAPDGTKYIKRINKSSTRNGGVNIAEYNWDDHGYTLMERYYDGIAPLISGETQLCESLCESAFGASISSSVIAKAGAATPATWWWMVRLYVLNLYGVIFDEYSGESVNDVVSLEVKRYVHRITCVPEEATIADVVWIQCRDVCDEHKLLIGLVVMEARRMAELILACNAVQSHLVSDDR